MRRLTLLIVTSLIALACQAPKRHAVVSPIPPTTAEPVAVTKVGSGADGETCEDAVVITGVRGELDGVRAEYSWIAERYPGYRVNQQALLMDKGRYFDLITFTTAGGETKETCFDITEFYGKF